MDNAINDAIQQLHDDACKSDGMLTLAICAEFIAGDGVVFSAYFVNDRGETVGEYEAFSNPNEAVSHALNYYRRED